MLFYTPLTYLATSTRETVTEPPEPRSESGSGSGSGFAGDVRLGFSQRRYSVNEGELLYICVSVLYGFLESDLYLIVYTDYYGYYTATGIAM